MTLEQRFYAHQLGVEYVSPEETIKYFTKLFDNDTRLESDVQEWYTWKALALSELGTMH